MKEIFIISEKTTGRIKGSGNIDRAWDLDNLDGSTVSERIATVLENNLSLQVGYLPKQTLPDHATHKIEIGESGVVQIVLLGPDDILEDSFLKEKDGLKSDLKGAIVWQYRMIQAIWETGVSKGVWSSSDIKDTDLKQKYVEWGQILTRLEELGDK